MRFVCQNLNAVVIFLVLGLVLPSLSHAEANCAIDMAKLYRGVAGDNQAMLRYLERGTGDFFHGRLSRAFEDLPEAKLIELFTEIGPNRISEIFWAIKSGEIRATKEEEKFFEDLMHLMDEKPGIFAPGPDLAFRVRQGLKDIDAWRGYTGADHEIPELVDRSLASTEREVIARALAEHTRGATYENSRFWDRLVRFFDPHYRHVRDLITANNNLRRALQLIYATDGPSFDALAKYSDSSPLEGNLPLTDEEISRLRGLTTNSAADVKEVNDRILTIYGQQISPNQPVGEEDVRIRLLSERAEAVHAAELHGDMVGNARDEMDVIDEVVASGRARAGLDPKRPMNEYHDTHLQIRNPQYIEETASNRSAYERVILRHPEDPEYQVTKEWTVTVYYSKIVMIDKVVERDGKKVTIKVPERKTTSRTFTESAPDSLSARYEDVLRGSVVSHDDELAPPPTPNPNAYPGPLLGFGWSHDSASASSPHVASRDETRITQILQNGADARASETPFRTQVAQTEDFLSGIQSSYASNIRDVPEKIASTIAAMDAEKAVLVQRLAELEQYARFSDSQIRSQWRYDIPGDFRDRNNRMIDRYVLLIKRLEFLQEQIRRNQATLEVAYRLPDYSQQLQQLRDIHDRNRLIQFATGGAVAVTGGVSAYLSEDYRANRWWHRQYDDSWVDQGITTIWNFGADVYESGSERAQEGIDLFRQYIDLGSYSD